MALHMGVEYLGIKTCTTPLGQPSHPDAVLTKRFYYVLTKCQANIQPDLTSSKIDQTHKYIKKYCSTS